MTPEEQELIKNAAIVAAGVGVTTAAIVSSAVLLINGWRQRVAESKRHKIDADAANIRHFRELALEAAIADWKHRIEEVEKWGPRVSQHEHHRPSVAPLDQFIIRKLKMIQVFGDGSISVEDLPAKWAEMAAVIKWINGPSVPSKSNSPEE